MGKRIYVDTVGRNKKLIQEYINHQLDEDQLADQLSIKEYIDPFTGSENKKVKKITPLGVAERTMQSANLFRAP